MEVGYWYQLRTACALAGPQSVVLMDGESIDLPNCMNPVWTLCRGSAPVVASNTTDTVYPWTSTSNAWTEFSTVDTRTLYTATTTVTSTITVMATTETETVTIRDNLVATTTVQCVLKGKDGRMPTA